MVCWRIPSESSLGENPDYKYSSGFTNRHRNRRAGSGAASFGATTLKSPSMHRRSVHWRKVKNLEFVFVDDLLKLQFTPDIIHGHHAPNTGEAIIAFPNTPAIWICHSASAWFDAPPRFSQILRIFAVDEACKARLVKSDGVSADDIEILHNAVDFRRIRPRPFPLPSKPLRALSLVKHSGPEVIIAEACRRTGVQFEAYGHGVPESPSITSSSDAPKRISYSRQPAHGVGGDGVQCMVVLMDGRGFGGLVDTQLRSGAQLQLRRRHACAATNVDSPDRCSQCILRRRRRVRQSPREAGCRSGSAILQPEDIYASVVQSGTRRVFRSGCFRSEQIQFCRTYVNKLEPMGQWARNRASTSPDTNNSNAPDRSGLRRRYAASSADKQTTL